MQPLDSQIQKFVSDRITETRRKNIAAYHYWYPLCYATYDTEEITAALQCLLSFRTSMAEKTIEYEREFAKQIRSMHGIFVNSGSSADLLACKALVKTPTVPLEVGDKVLVPAITWPTQIWSIIQAGLIPVLFDCDKDTFNPDILTVPEHLLDDCQAVFTTHILGTCADMDVLSGVCDKYNLILLEDSCESLGSSYNGKPLGTFGCVGTFSSFFSHHITTLEGGMLVTSNNEISLTARLLRSHGWLRSLPPQEQRRYCDLLGIDLRDYEDIDPRYHFIDEGYNLRPTELNSAIGIEQLRKIDSYAHHRKLMSDYFYGSIANLKHICGPRVHENCQPCFMALPMTISSQKAKSRFAIQFLEDRGIESRPLIAGNILRHPAASRMSLQSIVDLQGADHHHDYSFYVGLTPKHTSDDIQRLLEVIIDLDNSIERL